MQSKLFPIRWYMKKYGEKDNSRVDTGRLRNSVAHAVHGHDAYIGSNLEYAA